MISLKPTRPPVALDTRQRFLFSFFLARSPQTSADFARPDSRYTPLKIPESPLLS
jgi:hypothetical protein